MDYQFYGWEHGNIPAKNKTYYGIETPWDLYDALSKIWCARTCTPRLRQNWSEENRTLGQCSITAFLAQDIFGGKVYGIPRAGGSFHCYNVVGDCVFDLTSEQFGEEVLSYEGNPEQFREVHFAKEEKRLRYEHLREMLLARQDKIENRSLCWEEVKTEHVVRDEWIDLRRSDYRFPDGTVCGPFYSYSRRDYVVVAASDEDGNYICVRQFRQGIGKVTTEFPAGGLERSDHQEYRSVDADDALSEDALEAAKRELLEETGYESKEWTHLLTIPSNATIADNFAHIFMAKNCRKVTGQHLDDTEFLHVKLLSSQEIERRIHGGDFLQAVHVMAWLLVKERTAAEGRKMG